MEIGKKLNLLIQDTENNQMMEYRSTIIGINQKYLFIDYPINKDTQRTSFFPNGTILLATYVDKDKNLYQFHTKVRKRTTLTIPGLAIDIPEKAKLKQIQRREYVRIMTSIDIAIHPTDQSFSPFTTVTNDISGGGISVVIPPKKQLKIGQEIFLWMVLHMKSEIRYIHLKGEIMHVYHLKNDFQTVSVKFISITDQTRQNIIQFGFEKQREARNKELI